MMREDGRKCILAVDDAAIILQRITDALGKHYDVVTVNSGVRALKYLDKNRPDLILLDIRMPIKDGFETLREIQAMEDRADIPGVMLTGMESKRFVMEGINLGIRGYVLKPFAPDDLLSRMARNSFHEDEVTTEDLEEFSKEYLNVLCGKIAGAMFQATQVLAHFSPPQFYKGRYEPEGQEVQFVLTYSAAHREGAQLIHHMPRSHADGAVSDQS